MAPDHDVDAERARLTAEVERLRSRFPTHPRRYLYVLLVVGAVDAADRTILSSVFEDVRRAFDVGDDQLGLLAGAYSFVATLSAIPFGWLADRWHRVRLIALGFVPWAIAMFWTGAAQSFGMMFAARLFLGTIEATNGPSTPSLLGDYYPVERRGRVYGIYGIGTILGFTLGLAAGGVLATLFGWRMAFFIWGALGLVCGAAVLKLLPEPQRGIPDALHRAEAKLAALETPIVTDGDDPGRPDRPGRDRLEAGTPPPAHDYRSLTARQATRQILRVKTMWVAFLAGAAAEFFLSALGIWAPTFFRRYHAFTAASAGILVASLAMSAVAGIFVGGRIGDRFVLRGRPGGRMALAACSYLASVAFLVAGFGLDELALVIPVVVVAGFLIGLPQASLNAVQLDIIVPHLRGRAAAVRSILRVGATALAPILFGFLSDRYGLRSAMLVTAPAMGVAGAIALLGIPLYPRDMAHAQAESLRQQRLEDASDRSPDEVASLNPP